MTLREQLYLLQLEDYDLERFNLWRQNNPDRNIYEKKGKIKWTVKARILYFWGRIFGLESAVKIFAPVDNLAKNILVLGAALKLRISHQGVVTIGVTGSWGKTTLKEQLAAILALKYRVFKTWGNNNTLLGVARNVLRMPIMTNVFVCEMGAYRPGDIKSICDLVKPKVGIVTAIGPMHLERFGSLEQIKETKFELLQAIPSGGLIVPPEKEAVRAICDYFGIDYKKAKEIIANLPAVAHRLHVSQANGLKIIDDSYNSNPAGFARALEFLEKTAGQPKILVTPGMIEMGRMQYEENKKAAEKATTIADEIIFVGSTNRQAWADGLKKFKKAHFVVDLDEGRKILEQIAQPGAVILFENDLPDHYF